MISKSIEKALNEQINAEMYSAYLYLSMESYFRSLDLSGFANWMRVQVQEELMHAMKMYDFVDARGGRIILKAIAAPQTEWKSPLAVFEATYKHEQKVTGLINALASLAIKEKDHATHTFLQWFVNEQVEEESSADKIIQQTKMMKDAPGGMFMLDRELGLRVFTPPATTGEKA
ncbi:MAG: ferritin [Phycisphaerae bacterium]|nr:ferritin [Phycisphaerae bacterium]MDD5380089.1 ferritin [Phycisphaerae bacterium]